MAWHQLGASKSADTATTKFGSRIYRRERNSEPLTQTHDSIVCVEAISLDYELIACPSQDMIRMQCWLIDSIQYGYFFHMCLDNLLLPLINSFTHVDKFEDGSYLIHWGRD